MPFLILLLSCLLGSTLASSITMPLALPERSFGLGLSTLHLQQPDSSSEQRYRIDGQAYEKLTDTWRIHSRIGIAHDTRPRSDAVRIHQNMYEGAIGLQITTTKLFRYAFGLGPLVILEQTETDIDFKQHSKNFYNRGQLAWLAELELDYAFNENWQLELNLAQQFRSAAHKQDLCFGVGLLYNTTAADSDKIVQPNLEP